MTDPPHLNAPSLPPDYSGRILTGDYSRRLRNRVTALIRVLSTMERIATPVMMYISAWSYSDDRNIWYEFASRRFLDLLNCNGRELPAVFRNSVLDQRVYRMADVKAAIERENRSAHQLDEERGELRAARTAEGSIDAVYKVKRPAGSVVWLKDLATVEIHREDRICLSVGNLTPVTKEMRSEEERIEKERLRVSLEMAGAVCHELNQPIQGISGYAETLLSGTDPESHERRCLTGIMSMTERMGKITRKLTKITRYETKDYLKGIRIVDIDRSSEDH